MFRFQGGLVFLAIGTTVAWAISDNHLDQGLDAAGYPINMTHISTMSEGNSLITEPRRDCSCDGRPTESCNIGGGYCIHREADCPGAVDRSACRSRGCKCCMPNITSDCRPKRSCSSADGYCVQDVADCHGVIDMRGCRGAGCMCCLPNGHNLPWVYLDGEAFVPFQDVSFEMDWYRAQSLCRSYGLNLYHPHDILAVAEYLDLNTNAFWYWLGAKGDEDINQFWFNGVGLTIDDPWYLPEILYNNGTCDCLAVITWDNTFEDGTVLFAGINSCTDRTNINPLCG